jgi:ribonucleotide reductase alpha subunit
MKDILIVKRDGRKEPLNLDKLHFVVEQACDNLSGVSASLIEMNANLQLNDGISSSDIQQILIKSASDLISLDNPNYQYAAARLLLSDLYKKVFGKYTPCSLQEMISKNIELKVYDSEILTKYTSTEIKKLNTFIKHDRDLDFTYAGLSQMLDKYLVQDRVTGKIHETPQFAFMLIAMTLFSNYPIETRMTYVKAYYDALSQFKLNAPTPVIAGVRTPTRQFASCVLVDVGDSLNSIFSSITAIGKYAARRAGLGINFSRIRGINSNIRNGEVKHTGVIPFLKVVEATLGSAAQGGIRASSSTVTFPFFHQEIESVLVLKNNKGTEDARVRRLDYSISMSKLFYERIINNEEMTLFSPNDAPDLFEKFGFPEFDELYLKYERNKKIRHKKVNALELMKDLLTERIETGRIYIMNIDHCNTHSSFLEQIVMSNLCVAGDTTISIMRECAEIEDLEVEDIKIQDLANEDISELKIWSRNIETGMYSFEQILDFKQTSESAKVLKITLKDNHLICTPYHKIYTHNRGYVLAKDLIVGQDQLDIEFNKDINTIQQIEYLDQEIPVYDITVENTHNFYANNILVHNCQEITLFTKPLEHIDDPNGEIALCILSSINVGLCKDPSDLEYLCDIAVRGLDELIDYQDYPIIAAEKTKKRRSLGIGFTGLAHYLAKQKVKYSDLEAAKVTHELAEALQYYCLKASNQLAKEKGACEYFHLTKYSQGILPIDTYKKDIDEVLEYPELKLDWQLLRDNIKEYGLRNSTLTAQAPVESCQRGTNKLSLADGRQKSFYEIFKEIGFDYKAIESDMKNEGHFFLLPQSIFLEGQYGDEEVTKVYYNGFKNTYNLKFEDDSTYSFTGEHRLLKHYADVNEDDFIQVKKIKDGDEIVWLEHKYDEAGNIIRTIQEYKVVKFVTRDSYKAHTWDVSTPSETFLLGNGCVSHNSSLVTNSTNGIEAVRSLLIAKKSKKAIIKQIVPQYSTLKNYYTLQWEQEDNKGYLNIVGAVQKFFDQSISANEYYDPLRFPEHKIPLEQVLEDILYAYKIGVKTHYYCNVKDNKVEDTADTAEYEKIQSQFHGEQEAVKEQEEPEYCEACAL